MKPKESSKKSTDADNPARLVCTVVGEPFATEKLGDEVRRRLRKYVNGKEVGQ